MKSPGSVSPLAALLDDDTPFLVDLGGIVDDEMRVVMHDQDAGVDNALVDEGNVGEHVDGLLDSGGSVDVATEGSSDALEIVEDLLSGEVLRSVEAHVLEEVGETVLVGGLLNCADVGGEVELGPSGGFLIVTDVVGESVLEMTYAYGGIIRKVLELLPENRTDGEGYDSEK